MRAQTFVSLHAHWTLKRNDIKTLCKSWWIEKTEKTGRETRNDNTLIYVHKYITVCAVSNQHRLCYKYFHCLIRLAVNRFISLFIIFRYDFIVKSMFNWERMVWKMSYFFFCLWFELMQLNENVYGIHIYSLGIWHANTNVNTSHQC